MFLPFAQGKRIKIVYEIFSHQRFNLVYKGGSSGALKFIYIVL
jgi:hypothetical protein